MLRATTSLALLFERHDRCDKARMLVKIYSSFAEGAEAPLMRGFAREANLEELGIKLDTATLLNLGRAKPIVVDKDNMTIIDGAGKKAVSRVCRTLTM